MLGNGIRKQSDKDQRLNVNGVPDYCVLRILVSILTIRTVIKYNEVVYYQC